MNWALITTELVWSASSTGNIKRPLKLGENTRKALSRDRMFSQFLEFFSVKFTVLDKRPHKYGLLATDVRDQQTTAITTVKSLHNSQPEGQGYYQSAGDKKGYWGEGYARGDCSKVAVARG